MPPSSHRSGSPSRTDSVSSEPNYIEIDIRDDMAELKRSQPRGRRVPSPQGWVGAATELHINLRIDIGDRSFFLHEFPLLSKSEKLNRLVFESRDTEKDHIILSDIPGGADTFELVARFLYGGKFELTPHNVAALRCAADYLEMSESSHGNGGLAALTENYLNLVVTGSWRDSIIVLKSCTELAPWADDLEIVRRCSESVAWKCSTDPHGIRWSFSAKEALRDWWFRDVCSLSIDTFSKVIQALTAKGLNQTLLAAVVGCYAEKWLPLAPGSDTLTTLKTKEESQQASFVAFTGFNQDIVAKDAKKAQHKSYRAIIQGIVKLLPPQSETVSVKLLLKLLRVACAVDAGSLCKTDLVKRIAPHLDKLSLEDLLIPASGESTYDVDVFQQILEFYLQKNYASSSPPFSPRSTVSGSSTSGTTSTSSLSRSISSVSATDLSSHSGSSLITESSSDRSVSGSSTSDSSSIRSSISGSNITGSSSVSSSRSGSSSFVSTSSETTDTSRTCSRSSSETSSPNLSGDEGVKAMPEKKFFVSTEGHRMRSHLAPTTTNFKLGQLLEMYLVEVARDSTISLAKFITLADLVTEFPRDSDDGIYRVIDTYLRVHPALNELERRKLCRVMDTGALSLAACVHAASNERLPVRVVVQVLFSEQIKLRNAMTGNEVMIDKEVETTRPPQFSSTTSTTDSSSDPSTTTSSSSATFSVSTKSRTTSTSTSTSNATGVNPSVSSVASSQLPGGLNMKDTLRSLTAEVESLKKQLQELETVKSQFSLMESLQLEIHSLSSRFQEMTHDYTGMTHQVEELTKASKHKSGWGSGWKKVTKSFHLKDNHDYTPKLYMEQHNIDTTPAPRGWPIDIPVELDIPQPVALSSTKSETIRMPKTPGDSNLPPKQELLLNPMPPKSESKPNQEAVIDTLNVPVKDEPVIETELSIKDSSNVSADMPEEEIPTSTPTGPEALERSLGKPKDRRRDDSNVVTKLPRRSRQARSASPVRSPRHHYDSDTSSVTSTSSYTSTSTSTSVSSYSSHGHNRASSSRHRRRSEGHRRDKSPSRSGGHHNSSVQKSSDRSAGLQSRKHRQKEGSEHHSHQSHHSGHHHSLDSYPRHSSSKDHHRSQHASHHSSQRRKDSHAKEVSSKPSSQRQRRRRPRPHHKEVCSDSDSSTDSGTRRRHR